MFSFEFCEISKNTFFTELFDNCFKKLASCDHVKTASRSLRNILNNTGLNTERCVTVDNKDGKERKTLRNLHFAFGV